MNPVLFIRKFWNWLNISRQQFLISPVFQQFFPNYPLIFCQFPVVSNHFQNFHICRISSFCLFPRWNLQFFKQNFPQLLWRINIKFFTSKFINLILKHIYLFFQLILKFSKILFINFYPSFLHLCQHWY